MELCDVCITASADTTTLYGRLKKYVQSFPYGNMRQRGIILGVDVYFEEDGFSLRLEPKWNAEFNRIIGGEIAVLPGGIQLWDRELKVTRNSRGTLEGSTLTCVIYIFQRNVGRLHTNKNDVMEWFGKYSSPGQHHHHNRTQPEWIIGCLGQRMKTTEQMEDAILEVNAPPNARCMSYDVVILQMEQLLKKPTTSLLQRMLSGLRSSF